MLPREKLKRLYKSGLSMQEISDRTGWSYHQITYWMSKHGISRRSRSEAMYTKYNPDGDPFKVKKKLNLQDAELKGLGLGLFWGEGCKRNKGGLRLGNTDPRLIKKFMEFLDRICDVKKDKLKFNLQIFGDLNKDEVLNFWMTKLGIKPPQFYKVIITPSRGKGTYKRKLPYGVLTINFNNTKLKKMIDEMIENF